MKVLQSLLVFLLVCVACHAKRHHATWPRRRLSARLVETSKGDSATAVGLETRATKDGTPQLLQNPCTKFRCRADKECALDERKAPRCVCIQECPDDLKIGDSVCGSDNRTYESECALRRWKCVGSQDKVTGKKLKHLRVNYFGPCKVLTQCKKSEYVAYPIRVRSWMKNVFLQMYETPEEDGGLNEKQRYHGRKLYAEREKLQDFEEHEPHNKLMEQEFQKFYSLYRYPVHWKFAELDRKPKDKLLSKRELEPLRAPLIPMEHCTKPFFNRADRNKDKKISLEEWGLALGLSEGDIDQSLAI